MNVDEALRQFSEGDDFPAAAMQWALDNWSEASPRFIARLRAYAAGGNRSSEAMDAVFTILHLCGEKQEERAYAPLCQIIANDEAIEELLGDAVTETLTGILIGVYDGDIEPLKQAIEAEKGDEFARSAALEALAYLVRTKGALSDDDMRAYLRVLRREAKPRGDSFLWTTWAATAANLGYDDLRLDVATLNKDGWIGEFEFTLEDFDRHSRAAREDEAGLGGFEADDVRPFANTVETLASWAAPTGDEWEDEDDGDPFRGPVINPFRDVGRNDPCPCGSGKKYKKCCLAG
ncbi:MAG: DUF1186 domain-containing protein [Hyphomicrobiales bacterium]|nr:DUF1186 domain-containing protein [Hyphomicrobiales bacterium]